jgi:hypothetical protein
VRDAGGEDLRGDFSGGDACSSSEESITSRRLLGKERAGMLIRTELGRESSGLKISGMDR